MVLKLVRIQRCADGGWHNAAYVGTTKKGKRRDVGALIFGYPCESIIAERELNQMEMFSEDGHDHAMCFVLLLAL